MATTDPTTWIEDEGPEHEFSWDGRDAGLLQIGADEAAGVVYIAVNDQHVVELPLSVGRRAVEALAARIEYLAARTEHFGERS